MTVQGLDIGILINDREAGPELRRLTFAFERAGDEVADIGKYLFPKLTPIFEAEERRQFDAEGGGPTGAWAALSPGYAAWKEAHYHGKTINRRTDALYEALTSSSSVVAARSSQGNDFEFGTRGLDYASHVQMVRPVFDMSEDFEADVHQAALDSVREGIKAGGLEEFVEVTP